MVFFLFFILIGIGFFVKYYGLALDQQVERNSSALASHPDGVLKGAASKTLNQSKETAVVFVHGFTDTPQIFDEIIDSISWENTDYYAPLLPYHGRSIHEMIDFSPETAEIYVHNFMEQLHSEYQKLILVGQSMGGSILINLIQNRIWDPKRVTLILMAPAVFLYTNTWYYRFIYRIYPYFRNYWVKAPSSNSDNQLGVVGHSDIAQTSIFSKKQSAKMPNHPKLNYYTISAVKQLHDYCQNAEKILRQLTFPHTVLIAEQDSRVKVNKLRQVCQSKPSCHLIILEDADHLIFQGKTVYDIAQQIKKALA